ncbi:MAG TPA: LysR family transcriptional regulator [Acidimicrobiales bacterium]|nr:LysR family transcriptional regulator [Acidimicrobiales bacterium]
MTKWPDLDGLALLTAVAETGSISRAADSVGITQPAASLRLKRLEAALGITLLERTTSGTRLTPEGAAVVGWATPALDATRELLDGARLLATRRRHHLRVAASLTVAEYLLPAWLSALHASDPDIAVSLHMANSYEVEESFSRRAIDLGFVEGARVPPGLQGRTVAHDELVVVVAPDHPFAHRRRPIDAAALARAELVAREPGSGTREVLERALARHGLTLAPTVELASTTAIKAAVADGIGVAVVGRATVARELSEGRLVAVAVADLDLRRAIRAVWPRATSLSPAGRRLLASIRIPVASRD